MEGPPLEPRGEDITWPDHLAPRGRKASSTRKVKPQTSNLKPQTGVPAGFVVLCVQWLVGGPPRSCFPVSACCAVLRVRGVAAGRALVCPDGGFS